MELSELTAYAGEKYQILEQHKWADFPGFSVLCHPRTGKWIALLMRQWDTDSGTQIERCDLKCGAETLLRWQRPYLSPPLRMRGNKWIDVAFDAGTEPDVVFRLLDQAVTLGEPQGFTIVLGSQLSEKESVYRETPLPFADSLYRPERKEIPAPLRELRRMYDYGSQSAEARAENFYRQAVFMRDYEDDVPWTGDFTRYYPTYRDLTTRQLRGYFGWRTRVRRGDFQPIASSAAYIYLYELLNGVGADSPAECLQRLREFEHGFLDSGIGEARMRSNLRRWMLEYAVLNDLPPELAQSAADPEMIGQDAALAVLRAPDERSDEEVFSSLCRLGGGKSQNSPVLTGDPGRGQALFAQAWRKARAYRWDGADLFSLCFGKKVSRRWYPLANAIYYDKGQAAERDYALDECRSYRLRSGVWRVEAYEKAYFDKARLQGFVHETDARLRRYLKTGRYLKESPADGWAVPYIDAVIEEDRRSAIEASRPKITIDLAGLEQIRADAATTRESLLTAEEIEDIEEIGEPALPEVGDGSDDLPLDEVQTRVLRALLEGWDTTGIIRENHQMPSVISDAVNEALFDRFGDTVVLCEDDRLFLVDDYIEDLKQLLGGGDSGRA